MNINIESIKGDMRGLRGVFIISLPDNFLIFSWKDEEDLWDPELVGASDGSIIKANRKTLEALGVSNQLSASTIETDALILTIRPLSKDFGFGFVFDRQTPIGMIRLHGERLFNHLRRDLEFKSNNTNPGKHLMAAITSASKNLDADLLRISLHSGVDLERFQNPQQWSQEELEKVQRSTELILGVVG